MVIEFPLGVSQLSGLPEDAICQALHMGVATVS